MTVSEWLREAAARLAISPAWQGPDVLLSPRREAEWLLAASLTRTMTWLLTWPDKALTAEEQDQADRWLRQRCRGVPLAYLTGEREFWSLPLRVTADTLVPRPDSERLVEVALACWPPADAPRVLDLGTGSGALALALKQERPDAQLTAVDRSEAALAVAAGNGERLALPVRWLQGDWFSPVGDERFHLVVSNPPYLAPDDPHLDSLQHEPRTALVADEEGLADLRRLCRDAPAHLLPGGWLLLEHGAAQASAVRDLLTAAGFAQVRSWQDLGGCDRVSGGCLPVASEHEHAE